MRRNCNSTVLLTTVITLLTELCGAAHVVAQDAGGTGALRSVMVDSASRPRNTKTTEAPRAGSIDLDNEPQVYQQAIFEPPPKLPATGAARRGKYRRASAGSAEAFADHGFADNTSANEPSRPRVTSPRRRRASVNRAIYQDPGAPQVAPNPTPAPPEDLPMPGSIDASPHGEMMPLGSMPMQAYGDGSVLSEGGCASGNCGGCATCGNVCDPCDTCEDWYPGKDLTLFAGVHGFKNSVDNGQNGNFGFQEGVNWSSPFWNAAGVGFQLGFQAMQSDFHETSSFTGERSQYFLTTGFFRRQLCDRGWQWGVVYDHLSDEFVEDFEVGQIRGELSYLFRGHELGYWFASGASDDVPGTGSTTGITSYETVDMHALFYRRRLMNGGEGRLWGGFTKESDTLFGGDLRVPLACDWDVVAAFNYLAPHDDTADDGSFPEAWNIGINLVWYVCPQGAMQAGGSRYRPLFNVADNGTLIVNTLR